MKLLVIRTLSDLGRAILHSILDWSHSAGRKQKEASMPRCPAARRVALGSLTLVSAAGFWFLTGEAQAINRYVSTSMTCSKVKATISRDGAAIMQHRSPRTGVTLYDRYVKNRQFCAFGETTELTYIPTSDLPACPVSRCKQIEFFDFR
jgi:hypothetical protein